MPSDFSIRDTAHMGAAALAAATNITFADYFMPISHTAAGFAAFCRGFSVDLAQSVLLEHRDGRLAGLSMLAMRGTRGWCGGFGLAPEFRGQGLSGLLVEALLDRARTHPLASMQLEVLVQNVKAIRTYTRAGFQTQRDLVVLSGGPGLTGADTDLDVQPVAASDAVWLTGLSLPAATPCWQRDAVSTLSQIDVRALTARRAGRTVGVLLYRSHLAAGPVAVSHLAFTDEAVARALLARALSDAKTTQVFVLNEPDGSPLHVLAPSLGLREVNRQHEMTLTL